MSSDVLISDSKEFRDYLFNHPAFIGQHFSTYDVDLYLKKGVSSMFKYVLWVDPEKPNSFYISYVTFYVQGPSDTILANIEVNYLNGEAMVTSTAYDIGHLARVSYLNDRWLWDEFTIKTKVPCSHYSISDIVRILEVREAGEMARYYSREQKVQLNRDHVRFTISPFNKFESHCSVFCQTKTKGKPCEKGGPWPLWKMAAFLVHETVPLETILEKVPELLYPHVLQCDITTSDIGHTGGIYKGIPDNEIEDIPRLLDE